jgi:hypothetical protein
MNKIFWLKKVKGRDHLEDLGIKVKVKVRLSLCLTRHDAMNTYWGSGVVAPRIL